MSVQWAVRLPLERAASLGALRLLPGVEALRLGERVYVRGQSERLPLEVRSLPGEVFTVLADGQWVEAGRSTPTARTPAGAWLPLPMWLEPELPSAALDAAPPAPAPLRLVRDSGGEAEPNVLLLPLERWAAYAESAPAVRLARLAFACDAQQRTVLRGEPLPPLAGRRLVERSGVAVEAGWSWSPAVDAEVLADSLGLAPGELCLLLHDAAPQRISADAFVAADRSAVRLTQSPAR